MEVCELTSNKDVKLTLYEEFICSNAVFLAESKYSSNMHPMSLYNDEVLIGFFIYGHSEKIIYILSVTFTGKINTFTGDMTTHEYYYRLDF